MKCGWISVVFSPSSTIVASMSTEIEKETYVCLVCGYIYDPDIGDPSQDIEVGTSFQSLPDDWVCPLCFVSKDDFEKE